MAVVLKIKRSATKDAPAVADLQVGELAYGEGTDPASGIGNLYYKATDEQILKIGGNVDVTKLSLIESRATRDQVATEVYFNSADTATDGNSLSSFSGTGAIVATNVQDALLEIESRLKVAEDDLADTTDIEDLVGAMFTTNTESGIVTGYDGTNRKITLDVNDPIITLAGPVTGQVQMTNLGDITINTTIEPDTVTLGTQTVGQYASTVAVSGLGLTTETPAADDGTAYTIVSDASTANTPNTLVYRTAEGDINAVDVDASGDLRVGQNAIITGDLTVNGTTTTVNSTTVTYDDPVMTLGGDTAPTANFAKDSGIEFRWHDGTAAKVGFFGFDESLGQFTFIPDAVNTDEVFSGAVGTINAAVQGNADTATKYENPLTINLGNDLAGSVLFSGDEGSVTLNATIQPDSVALGTDTTGVYASGVLVSGNGLSINTANATDGTDFTVNSNATEVSTPSTIVYRDANGDFSANMITADLTGNASTATALETGRTIGVATEGTYDATTADYDRIALTNTGVAPTFDATANISINAKVLDEGRYVHIYGDQAETITGVKTFTAQVKMEAGADGLNPTTANKTELTNFILDGGTF